MWQVIATGNSFSTLYLLNFKPDMWGVGSTPAGSMTNRTFTKVRSINWRRSLMHSWQTMSIHLGLAPDGPSSPWGPFLLCTRHFRESWSRIPACFHPHRSMFDHVWSLCTLLQLGTFDSSAASKRSARFWKNRGTPSNFYNSSATFLMSKSPLGWLLLSEETAPGLLKQEMLTCWPLTQIFVPR